MEVGSFYHNSNAFSVEKPDGKADSLGFISYGEIKKGIDIYPDAILTWEINLKYRYFEPPFVMRPKENGTYTFYWHINGIKSEAVVYEKKYVREEE